MKELDDFTVERLQAIAEPNALVFPPSHAEAAALARIALAAKTAEPVTWWTGPEQAGEMESFHDHETGSHQIPLAPALYATPVLNSPELPDSWIPCAERMPPDGEDVVCATEFFGPGDWRRKVGHYRQNGEWRIYGASWTPSHWQPLPAPPTTEK
ncbi:hypothetical protein AV650_15455 [Serratia fonticola]|nr:hypothetical protein AV650_15455 [Serratia fonticola]